MNRAEPQNPAETIPEGYRVFAHVACTSAKDIIAYLRRNGVRVVGNSQAPYGASEKADYSFPRYYIRPYVPTSPLAAPAEEYALAKRLLRKWYREEDVRIRPLLVRMRRDVLRTALIFAAIWVVLWLMSRSVAVSTAGAGGSIVTGWLMLIGLREISQRAEQRQRRRRRRK